MGFVLFVVMFFHHSHNHKTNNEKSGQVNAALLYSRLQVSHCIMNRIKHKLNDIILLYTKHNSDMRRFVSLDILYCFYLL